MTHELMWTAPQPFWTDGGAAASTHGALARPQILRFANDEFVPELLATLEQEPTALRQYAVAEETWRGPGAAPEPDPKRWLERAPLRLLAARRSALLRKGSGTQLASASGATAAVAPTPIATKLKLYQPAHQRHYLVSGALVCRTVGLPDRQIDPALHKTSFVMRRLLPKVAVALDGALPDPSVQNAWDEYAFVLKGKAGVWRKVGPAEVEDEVSRLSPAEERIALSTAQYQDDRGQRRRVYLGSVPVGRREAYQGAATEASAGSAAPDVMDPRIVMLYADVLGPWKALVQRAMENGATHVRLDSVGAAEELKKARPKWVFAEKAGNPGYDVATPDPKALRDARSSLLTASWYLLLDLYRYLEKYLKVELLVPLLAGQRPSGAAGALYDALAQAALPLPLRNLVNEAEPSGAKKPPLVAGQVGSIIEANGVYTDQDIELSLVGALRRIVPFADALENAARSFQIPTSAADAAAMQGWPDFLFLFADPWFGVLVPPPPANFAPPAGDYLAEKVQALLDTLAKRVSAALPAASGERLPEPTLASMLPADMRDAWYVMRFVYERPECAPFHGSVVSAASRPFRMAGFFDPDAPARPIRIGLPLDISPAGLRKFDKNAVFMMSDMLCGQVDRMKGMGLGDLVLSVLPWPFHKPLDVPEKGPCQANGASMGVMCSLSIPIITLCALLLLMIIVSLLDLIFRWLPYFVLCFPLPGFKGKKD